MGSKMRIRNYDEEEYYYTKSYPYSNVYDKLAKERVIFLAGEIDRTIAANITALIISLDQQDPEAPIRFYINSDGGDLVDGMFAIYDTIQMVRCPIHTICIGEASSSAAILLAAGTKGERKATWNSRIMIHQIQVEGVDGRGTDIDVLSKEIKIMKRRLTETLARHTGQTYRKVYRDCENDKYLSATEALDYGIIDAIVEPSKLIPELKTRKRSRKKTGSNNAV